MITSEILQKKLIPLHDEQITSNRKVEDFLDLERPDEVGGFIPRKSTEEHLTIAEYSKTPWGMKIIDAEARELRIAGIQTAKGADTEAMAIWRGWNMPQKETVIYKEAPTYGATFVEQRLVAGDVYPVVKCPLRTTVFWTVDDIGDALSAEFPVLAMERQNDEGSKFKIWDERFVQVWERGQVFGQWVASEPVLHGFPVCPFVDYRTDVDSRGRSMGRIRPFKHQINRIRKVTYDSTLVNHHNSWNVRTATGLGSIEDLEPIEGETDEQFRLRLMAIEQKVRLELETDTILTAASKDVTFGSLPATPPSSFVEIRKHEVKELAAVTDIPTEFLSGDTVAQSAEQAGNSRHNWNGILRARKATYANSHRKLFKLRALALGVEWDPTISFVWEEDDNASLAAQADALGKIASMLGVPQQGLWSRIPGVTPEMIEEWLRLKEIAEAKELAMTSMIADMGNSGTEDPNVANFDEETAE